MSDEQDNPPIGDAVLGLRLPGAVLIGIVSAITGGGAAIIAAPAPEKLPHEVSEAMVSIDRQLSHNLARMENKVDRLTEQLGEAQLRAGECCARVGALERSAGR